MMNHQFSKKSVYITGASAGIGHEMAKQIARAGGTVAMFARRKEPMERLAATLNAELKRTALVAFTCDVTNRGAVMSAFAAGNTVPMPMILEVEVAVRRMLKAIAARRRRHVFPWPVYLFTWLSKLVPDFLMAKLTHGKSYKDV